MGGPSWGPGSESLHLPGCPVRIPRIYLMAALDSPSEETQNRGLSYLVLYASMPGKVKDTTQGGKVFNLCVDSWLGQW